jgi:hypothetical protein
MHYLKITRSARALRASALSACSHHCCWPPPLLAVRVSGYRFGCRKTGVMKGTKYRGLAPEQRRRLHPRVRIYCLLVLAQHQHVPVAAVVDRQPVNNRTDAACHPAPGHNPGPCDTPDPVKSLR